DARPTTEMSPMPPTSPGNTLRVLRNRKRRGRSLSSPRRPVVERLGGRALPAPLHYAFRPAAPPPPARPPPAARPAPPPPPPRRPATPGPPTRPTPRPPGSAGPPGRSSTPTTAGPPTPTR